MDNLIFIILGTVTFIFLLKKVINIGKLNLFIIVVLIC